MRAAIFFLLADGGIRVLVRSRGVGVVYKSQGLDELEHLIRRADAFQPRFAEKDRDSPSIRPHCRFRLGRSIPRRVFCPALSLNVVSKGELRIVTHLSLQHP